MNNYTKFPLSKLLEQGNGRFIENDENSLTYEKIREIVVLIGSQLSNLGVKPGDSIGMVTPNGPEAAIIFVAAASFATAAPLNPAYTKEEFKFYLTDLKAKILILPEDYNSEAIIAANELKIRVVKIRSQHSFANISLTLEGKTLDISKPRYNSSTDISLVLHTSGTTSRPKIVPLSADNICVSARNIARTLRLTENDHYFNIMPLFHIHGLIAGVLTTLESGGSMFCSRGFDALKFFSTLDKIKPTWFSAVPTMHQAILSRAPRNAKIISNSNLKFIRSSSAALPIVVLRQLEDIFNCPVIEAYGMTEASHQMASNPLPPLKRKPGSVGLASGPEIRIATEKGEHLPPNKIGEIMIRGANVTTGYRNNLEANKKNFLDGWFRTGDQGVIDDEGYLTIKGRIKEIINRGGEKISPLEVDEILMTHPNVKQAVTFSIPHDKLGEDIGAVLVLKNKNKTNKADVINFLKSRIIGFKIPKTIVFLSEIPTGSTGKIQRIGLAKQLGIV